MRSPRPEHTTACKPSTNSVTFRPMGLGLSVIPPIIVPIEEWTQGVDPELVSRTLRSILNSYLRTLQHDRRHLRAIPAHPCGTQGGRGGKRRDPGLGRAFLDLNHRYPLLLQIKEAEASVLEQFTSKANFPTTADGSWKASGRCRRPVTSSSGGMVYSWRARRTITTSDNSGTGRIRGHWRHDPGWDGAVGPDVRLDACPTHTRSGNRIAIAAYLGKSDTFEKAVAAFAVAYADQNERDYARFQEAVTSGRLAARTGI